MIYWMIPYLVAYNASDAGDWRYGPEHVFKAEVRSTATTDNLSKWHVNGDIYIACRPMNASDIQCRVESVKSNILRTERDGTTESDSSETAEIGNDVLQVRFDEGGLRKLWAIGTMETCRLNTFFIIFSTLNWGISMSKKKFGRYVQPEKSMIGTCQTTFDIFNETMMKTSSNEEMNVEKAIEGYRFDVPGLQGRTSNATIVIEKNRNVDECTYEKPYLFGDCEESNKKHNSWDKTQVTSSRSLLYLGRNSFSCYTRNTGILRYTLSPQSFLKRRMFRHVDESLRLSLETIRPAKEAIRPTRDSANPVS